MFCGGLCEVLIRARGKLRGLLVQGWNRDHGNLGLTNFSEDPIIKTNKVTRDETSHFFRRMSLPVGGNGSKL